MHDEVSRHVSSYRVFRYNWIREKRVEKIKIMRGINSMGSGKAK